jgi:hypothetical protein
MQWWQGPAYDIFSHLIIHLNIGQLFLWNINSSHIRFSVRFLHLACIRTRHCRSFDRGSLQCSRPDVECGAQGETMQLSDSIYWPPFALFSALSRSFSPDYDLALSLVLITWSPHLPRCSNAVRRLETPRCPATHAFTVSQFLTYFWLNWTTNCKEQNPSWDANSRSPRQGVRQVL